MNSLWKGNYALVEGALAGGLDAYFGYPITPQNEITEYMSKRMREEKRVFLQTESELASINMVLGAAATGVNTMTSSSSPGISLMQEGLSYLVGSELPSVIVNVQRGGPGLGNISGAQGDYFQTVKGGGHGDYRMLVLTPNSVQEMYDMTKKAFPLAQKYRNPVIILSDGVIGQMLEPADIFPTKITDNINIPDRGWNLTGAKNRDSRFIRSLFMGEGELEKHNYKLFDKFKTMEIECDWEEIDTEGSKVILVGYGIASRINLDAYNLAKKKGLSVGYFRLKTAYPFPNKRLKELAQKSKFLVVELSMGQMVEDVILGVEDKSKVKFYGKPGGGLPEVDEIIKRIEGMI